MLIFLGSMMVMVLVFIGFIPAILSELWSLFKFIFFDISLWLWIGAIILIFILIVNKILDITDKRKF